MALLERQCDEFLALEGIYGPAFQEITNTKTVWRNQQPFKECRITVHALDDLADQVWIVLHFTRVFISPKRRFISPHVHRLPSTYPNTVPTIAVQESVGIANDSVQALLSKLKTAAKRLVPYEAIFELASEAATYITQHHAIIQPNLASLNDQAAARAVIEEEAQAARLSAQEELQRQKTLEERKQLLEEVEANKQRQKERHQSARKLHALPSSKDATEQASMPSKTFKNVLIAGRLQSLVVVQGSALPSAPVGTLHHAEGIDENALKHPAQLLTVDMSAIKPYLSSSQGSKRLAALTEHLDKLQSLSSKHLAQVYGYHFDVATAQLDILCEPLSSNLSSLMALIQSLPPDRILHLAQQIAEALSDLHAAGLLHKSLALDKLHLDFIDPTYVKLSGACYVQLLQDINRSTRFSDALSTPTLPEEWRCPESALEPLEYSKARDVWDFGILIASLHGSDVFASFAGPESFVESLEGGPIREALSQIFTPLKQRATVEQILTTLTLQSNMPTVKSPGFNSQTALSTLSPRATGRAASKNSSGPFWQPAHAALPVSRYRAEFEEVEFLGKGGFGKVVKALNKLDQNFYAIKKIKLSNDPATENKILREVTTWSRLSHPSIVRYHTAWVESEEGVADIDDSTNQGTNTFSRSETPATIESEDNYSDEELPIDGDVDIDFNVDLEDTDFLSVNPHMSTSSSYPRIHFGNDSDDSSMPSRAHSRLSLASTSQAPSIPQTIQPERQRTLYIQMEFISGRTLREAIDDGLSHDEAWRILSQILHAMAYFTSISITHRDLKPQNCFIDSDGQVKVGDFGLAVEIKQALDEAQRGGARAVMELSELTSGVGTSLYIAPEYLTTQRSGKEGPLRDRAYASRIDVYSLGIGGSSLVDEVPFKQVGAVFFEMVHPMKTKMERIMTIKNLRSPSIQFPPDFKGTAAQKQLVQSMLAHDPQLRPSPKDLLQSGILPAPLIDETVAEVSRLIRSSKSPHRPTVLKALLSVSEKEAQVNDLLFDYGSSTEIDLSAQAAKARLTALFEKRGAVELSIEGPLPYTPLYEITEGRRPVKYIDVEGIVQMLPYDQVVPLCRRVARDPGLSRLKRYTIGPVFRQRELGVGQPRAPVVASFDIVTPQYTLAAEAECLHLVDSILDEFGMSESYVHTLGHFGILQYALQDVPAEHKYHILRYLELSSSRTSHPDTRKALAELSRLPGVTGKTVQLFASLHRTFDPAHTPDRFDLETLLKSHPKLRAYIESLRVIIQLARNMGCQRKMVISPLLAVNVHLHQSKPTCLFQVSLPGLPGKSVQTIAVGGRYDGIATSFLPPDKISAPCVTGVSLALAQLAHAVEFEADARGGITAERPLSIRRCDVYVVSFVSGLEDVRLKLVADLWSHGIKADIMYDADISTPEQMIARRRLENILFLVIVKPVQAAREQTYKVRHLVRSGEDEVSRSELVDYLHEHIRDCTKADLPQAASEDKRANAQVGEIHFLAQQDDKKKQFMRVKNRSMVADKATVSVQQQLKKLSEEVPIYVVDLDVPAIEIMRYSPRWFSSDTDAFKRLVDCIPAAKRPSLHILRDAIRSRALENHAFVFLYFTRIDKTFTLHLE